MRWVRRVRARTGCRRARPGNRFSDHRAKCHASEHCPPPAHLAPRSRQPPPRFSQPLIIFRDPPRVPGRNIFSKLFPHSPRGKAKPAAWPGARPVRMSRVGAVPTCGVQAGCISLREETLKVAQSKYQQWLLYSTTVSRTGVSRGFFLHGGTRSLGGTPVPEG